jgi:hypothetical protein
VLPLDLGVFDGVGGWRDVEGSDPALYSRVFANLTAAGIASQRAAGIMQVGGRGMEGTEDWYFVSQSFHLRRRGKCPQEDG